VSWAEWLNPSTKWRGVPAAALRRSARAWLVWFVVWFLVWAVLGNFMFRFQVLPDASPLLLLLLFGSMVLFVVALFFSLARFVVSFLVE